jgi:hypothetical protein
MPICPDVNPPLSETERSGPAHEVEFFPSSLRSGVLVFASCELVF